MNDRSCVTFLQWALPRLMMRWRGFRKVRKQVCKRINRRIDHLKLADIDAYRAYLEKNEDEWEILSRLCRVTISRFYRDRGVFDYLSQVLLPAIAKKAEKHKIDLRIWSAGCSSGEEPYTLALIIHFLLRPQAPDTDFEIIASDIDPVVLERAAIGEYQYSSLRELPQNWQQEGFEKNGEVYKLKKSMRTSVRFAQLDIRNKLPQGLFDVILCRNLAFTYFDEQLQSATLNSLQTVLKPNGILVCGAHEKLPENNLGFVQCKKDLPIYCKLF